MPACMWPPFAGAEASDAPATTIFRISLPPENFYPLIFDWQNLRRYEESVEVLKDTFFPNSNSFGVFSHSKGFGAE